jgi:hypothetical protein
LEYSSAHLQEAEALYRADRAANLAGVWLPDAVDRKYPNAGRELGWFWVFPSQIQEYLGRANVETTMIYAHVVKELRKPARSPLDVLSTAKPGNPSRRVAALSENLPDPHDELSASGAEGTDKSYGRRIDAKTVRREG